MKKSLCSGLIKGIGATVAKQLTNWFKKESHSKTLSNTAITSEKAGGHGGQEKALAIAIKNNKSERRQMYLCTRYTTEEHGGL